MDELIIGQQTCCNDARFHKQFIGRRGYRRIPHNQAFDYFDEDFGQSLHRRLINKYCPMAAPQATSQPTNYPDLYWNVERGHFLLHQTQEMQEGLCGLEEENYASCLTGNYEGTVLIDAWFGDIGSWVSIIWRQLEARYVVVGMGMNYTERLIQLQLYHNDELVWKCNKTRISHMFNSFMLGMTLSDIYGTISNTDIDIPRKTLKNFVLENDNGKITIGSSMGYVNNQFTGISGFYFFGGKQPAVKL